MTAALDMHLDLPRFTAPALCAEVGGDTWYPEKGGSTREAKAICGRCDARDECLAYALRHGLDRADDGVWGGTSPRERRAMRRASEAAAAEAIQHPAGPRTLVAVTETADEVPSAPRARVWHPDELAAAVHQLRALGMNTSEIAEALAVSPSRVRAA